MASLSKADSRRMYSWWWNSHISPKNSKWLQENLTDVDIKVKAMIKLIEEDADSFARRAEMYYKKRPELIKLVEELYRAYRALAEKYDHATGALRQAHKTMSEAFPNQVPSGCDDSVPNSPYDSDPRTPDSRTIKIPGFDPDDFQKDGSTGTARKILSFSDSDGNNKHRSQDRNLSRFENVAVNDKEIASLKAALAKLEDEKEASMKQYLESLDKLSKLESEMLKSQEDSRELADRTSKAEAESHELKEMLQRLEAEKEESFELYHQAQKKIEEINEQSLKEEIKSLRDERDAAYDQYKQSVNMQSDLKKKLLEAEKEIETLKLEIENLTKEKEAQDILYQQCMETISSLELRLVCAEEEAKRLKAEIDNGVSLLKAAEEQRLLLEKSNKSLQMELESMGVRIGTQNQEITEKQKELGRLWTCIQEERVRFVEAETAFQTLQQLHAQSQEELRSMAGELQNRALVLRDIESRNQVLEGEMQKKIEENKNLSELNLSSAISLEEMQVEISSLKESNGKLEEEVDLRVDQRNALQQEIYCLKEELNELNQKHGSVLEQVAYVGLKPESLGSSVKELQNENFNLKEEWQNEKTKKAALLEKLEIMGQLLERNVVLENSLSDLGAELEGVRGKLKALEESYQSLSEEKSNLAVEKANLLGQLQVTTDNLCQVSEKNTVLENSLFDAHVKLEVLKQKSKSFEDSCQLLSDEKSALITEKGTLVSQMELAEENLKNLERKYADLEEKYSLMEKERESTLQKVEELNASLATQNQEHVTFAQKNDIHLHTMRSQIQLLQEESLNKSKEFEQELDKSFGSEIEILILTKCAQDLEEKNFSLFNDYHRLQEASKLSESLIHVLKQEKTENQIKIKSLSDHNNKLINGMHQLLKAAGLYLPPRCENGQEQTCFNDIQQRIEGKNRALIENEDRNMELVLETTILATLLMQFKTKLVDLEAEKCVIEQELDVRAEKILGLQNEVCKFSEMNEELRSKVIEGDINELGLRTQLENIQCELSDVQEAFRNLQMENMVVTEEKKSLLQDNVRIKNKICVLEEENNIFLKEVLSQRIFSQVLKNYIDEKHEELSFAEKKLEGMVKDNLVLKSTLQKSEHELKTVQSVCEKLNLDLVNGTNLLLLKEKELKILENDKKDLSEIVADMRSENDVILNDALSQCILSQTLKNYIDEKHEELSSVEKKLEDVVNENLHLRKTLEESEHEIRTVQSVRDKLNLDLMNGNKLLQLKEHESKMLENDKKELAEIVADLQRKNEDIVFTVILSQGIFSQTLKNHVVEKHEELSLVEKKFEDVVNENLDLRKTLEEFEQEVRTVQSVCDKLNLDLGNGNSLLQFKEKELNILKNDKKELSEIVADLRRENEDIVLNEVLSQGIFSHALKIHVDEKHEELYLVEKKFEEVVKENVDLRKTLEKSEHECRTVQSFRDKLNLDLVNSNNLLLLKEKELKISENDKKELSDTVADTRRENEIIFTEVLSQGIVSHALKNHIVEKHEELSSFEKKFEEVVNENVGLRKTLEELKHEIKTVQSICDKLNLDLANGSNLLQSKEKELKSLANDKKELFENVAYLRRENDIIINEVLSQVIVSQTLKNHANEKHEELSLVERKLEKSEREFRMVQSVCDKLTLDLVDGNNLLQSKERELKILVDDKNELSEIVADLRRENDIIFNEMLSQGIVFQTLKNYIDEKHEELSLFEMKLEEMVKENLDLKNTLEKSEIEIRTVQSVRDKLDLDLVNGNNLLQLKEKELKILSSNNKELSETVVHLRNENGLFLNDVLREGVVSETLKNYIGEKHEELFLIEKKLEDVRKTLEKSEHEFRTVQSICAKLKVDLANGNNLLHLKEKELNILENDNKELSEIVADLRRENNEVIMTNDQQGKQILELLEDNDHLSQESRILEVKMQQLTEKLEKTEEKTRLLETEASIIYRDLQTSIIYQVLLEQKISELTDVCSSLEEENNSKHLNNELLKARLDAYGPALDSLRDSIISLGVKTKVPQPENENEKGGESATTERDAFVELQDLQSKVKVIEMAVNEMQTLSNQQKLDSDAKLESAMMQIEELSQPKNYRMPKSTSEISEADPKDIMLDQASECSSYGVSKRGLIEGEIWETTDDSRTMYKHHPTASDVSLDNILEVSRRFKEPHEDGTKRKVLERLNSDVQKLTNLQITIDDLKRNVNSTIKSRRGKAVIECESLKGQLTEAESAIEKLYELNARLVKHIEGNPEKSSTSESGETESMRRKKVSEQAKRVSENIGRMQIEIQKIQFKLLKLDDENEASGKKRFVDTKKRVVLKDYLYGGGRTRATINGNNRRKKGHFCACVEPSTKGD